VCASDILSYLDALDANLATANAYALVFWLWCGCGGFAQEVVEERKRKSGKLWDRVLLVASTYGNEDLEKVAGTSIIEDGVLSCELASPGMTGVIETLSQG
jgi:hypothetical protein